MPIDKFCCERLRLHIDCNSYEDRLIGIELTYVCRSNFWLKTEERAVWMY